MKNENKFIGNKGEDLAAIWLQQNQFNIVERNWRFKRSEVDIIAYKKKVLHFIEVKTRTSDKFGFPEESIDTKKMEALKRAAVAYIAENAQWTLIQFDVLSILIKQEPKAIEYFFIEDVFF